jgi:hypothetical protein
LISLETILHLVRISEVPMRVWVVPLLVLAENAVGSCCFVGEDEALITRRIK